MAQSSLMPRARRVKPGREQPEDPRPGDDGAVKLGPLTETLGFHLRLAQEASFAAFARKVGDSGLRPGHYAALTIIHQNPGLSQTALGAAVRRDKSTLTPMVAELERRGLIRRERVPSDRRSYALSLTPAGGQALATLQDHAAAHDRELDLLVGADQRQAFLDALRRLMAGLEWDNAE